MSESSDTTTPQKRTRDAERTRAAILDAASELFVEAGQRGTSIRKVAERAGVTHGTLYLYFRDKDDLLYQLAEEQARVLLTRLRALPRTLEPVTRVREAFRTIVAFGLETPDHYHLIFALRPLHATRADEQALGPLSAEVFGFLFDTVNAAANRGLMSSEDSTSDAWGLLAAAHGIVELHRAGVIDVSAASAHSVRLCGVLVRGLR